MDLEADLEILILPAAHPVLNPIELCWHQIKHHVKSKNYQFTMKVIKQLVEEKRDQLDAREWEKCITHAMGYAYMFWETDMHVAEERSTQVNTVTDDQNDLQKPEDDEDVI